MQKKSRVYCMIQNFRRDFPSVIRVEPSSLCNLKCMHCPTGTIKTDRGLMKFSTFNLILQNLHENLSDIHVIVLYHGGEPLLNKQFSIMTQSIKDLGIPYVKTVSNGMLLSDKLIEEICKSGLDLIEFSLDGISFEQNDFIRKGCKGKIVVEKIKRLIDYKKTNALLKPEIIVSTTQFADNNGKCLSLFSDVPVYLLEAFSEEIKNKNISFKTTLAMKWPDMNLDEKKFAVVLDDNSSNQIFCDHVMNTITIRWNGDIVPCCYDLTSKLVLGNIHKDSLKTIWNNEKYLALRKSIHDKNFNLLCKNCNTVNQHQYLLIKGH